MVMYQSGSSPGLSVEPTQMSTPKDSVKSTPPDGGDRDTYSVGCSIVSHTFILVGKLGSLGTHIFCFVLFLNNSMESKAGKLTDLVQLKAV